MMKKLLSLVLTAFMLLFLTACGGETTGEIQGGESGRKTEAAKTETETAETETTMMPMPEEASQDALEILRECMDGTNQAAAAAYLGYRDETERSGDLTEWMWTNAPGLMGNMDFLHTIPSDRVLNGDYGDLYCIVPRDENTTLAVNHVTWRSKGNGVWPEADEVLYRNEYAEPLLLFVRWEEFRDEPDVEVIAVTNGGAEVTWYPMLNTEDGGDIKLPTGENYEVMMLDFSRFGDGWFAPTDIGLTETTWNYQGWMLELHDSNRYSNDTGTAELYYQSEDGQEYQLLYSGTWRMEDNCLRLELSAGDETFVSGSFPVLIDPSGEHLHIQQDRNTKAGLPFFDDGADSMTLTLSYG